ncbi:MAG: hypothetical protein ACKE9I_04020 [Methylophagaceae bacterium]
MDAAIYALFGALGGVVITQASNYFLEDKKSKNSESLKKLELEHKTQHELFTERRTAYIRFFKAVDMHVKADKEAMSELISSFSSATLCSSNAATSLINNVFELVRKRALGEEITGDEFRSEKAKLLAQMQRELN